MLARGCIEQAHQKSVPHWSPGRSNRFKKCGTSGSRVPNRLKIDRDYPDQMTLHPKRIDVEGHGSFAEPYLLSRMKTDGIGDRALQNCRGGR